MNSRNKIFGAQRGVSLVSTLLAAAIGAIIAGLIATVITDAVKGQRSVIDRDEMGEFALFMRNLLTTDSTCSSVLGGKTFKPGGDKADLSIGPVGYGENPAAVIQKGFQFAQKQMTVHSLTIEDKGLAPISFQMPVTDATGRTRQMTVNRYLARVRLQVTRQNGTVYRDRYYELPLLVNPQGPTVVACNNELSVADACQALGFKWDYSSGSAACVPQSACLSGGTYVPGASRNPATGDFSCPGGFQAITAGAINIRQNCAKGCDFLTYQTVIQCLRCPR